MASTKSRVVKVGKIGVIPFLILLVVFAYWFIQNNVKNNATADNIEFIYEHFNRKGELVDTYDQIGVENVEDIKLFIKGDKVRMEFGYIELTWTLEEFVGPANLEALKKIHVDVYRDKETGKIRVFYKGEELERWVS